MHIIVCFLLHCVLVVNGFVKFINCATILCDGDFNGH